MTGKTPHDGDAERRRAVDESLARVDRDSETLLRTTFEGASRHRRAGGPGEETDPIEIWGARIGRTAGGIFAVGLIVYLAWTYL
ncbi:hypothetical protein [Stappia sp. ES.058]|uniref:hypothetical protein n=1 Tax=Stappia sp. ES.058 TaxID=1881061 RepID=UPI0008796B9D|nr:hypothetical protein [Stappia sp. ES.058]SDU38269.1 hypothetical protein SAMN05428979_3364 [Stappia sp. ES.058]